MFNHFTRCALEATAFGEITQNNGNYAVQGHSPILVPNKSSYTTSYTIHILYFLFLILTYLLSCTVLTVSEI